MISMNMLMFTAYSIKHLGQIPGSMQKHPSCTGSVLMGLECQLMYKLNECVALEIFCCYGFQKSLTLADRCGHNL